MKIRRGTTWSKKQSCSRPPFSSLRSIYVLEDRFFPPKMHTHKNIGLSSESRERLNTLVRVRPYNQIWSDLAIGLSSPNFVVQWQNKQHSWLAGWEKYKGNGMECCWTAYKSIWINRSFLLLFWFYRKTIDLPQMKQEQLNFASVSWC